MALPSSFHEAGGIVSRAEKPALSFHNPSASLVPFVKGDSCAGDNIYLLLNLDNRHQTQDTRHKTSDDGYLRITIE